MSLSPIDDEDSLNAEARFDDKTIVYQIYRKQESNAVSLIGDNCSRSVKLARTCGVR